MCVRSLVGYRTNVKWIFLFSQKPHSSLSAFLSAFRFSRRAVTLSLVLSFRCCVGSCSSFTTLPCLLDLSRTKGFIVTKCCVLQLHLSFSKILSMRPCHRCSKHLPLLHPYSCRIHMADAHLGTGIPCLANRRSYTAPATTIEHGEER